MFGVVLFIGISAFIAYLILDLIVCVKHNIMIKAKAAYAAEQKALMIEQRKIDKENRDAEKLAKREAILHEKEKKEADKNRIQQLTASSNRAFLSRRSQQILDLIEIAENNQSGTQYGGKEWMKYQKQIMTYENQLQALKVKELKARVTNGIGI